MKAYYGPTKARTEPRSLLFGAACDSNRRLNNSSSPARGTPGLGNLTGPFGYFTIKCKIFKNRLLTCVEGCQLVIKMLLCK